MPHLTAPRNRERGTTLIEVLIATVVLTLAFLFVSGDMIASTQTEKEATNRGIAISMGNYLLDTMRQDSAFWSEESGGVWSGVPPVSDPCLNPWPPYDDNVASPTWHPMPTCASGPFADAAKHGTYQFMWNATPQASDPNAADLSVWIADNPVSGSGAPEVFELNQLNRNDPPNNSAGVTPPPPPGTPTPPPTATPKPPGSPTPKPSTTPTPKPSTSPTPKPSATPAPSPTPVPSPTVTAIL